MFGRIGHFVLTVADIDAACAVYERALGFRDPDGNLAEVSNYGA